MALCKRDFLSILSTACLRLDIPRNDVIVSHGGAALLMGYRKLTDDIDVSISAVHWNRLRDQGHHVTHLPAKGDAVAIDIIELHGVDWHVHSDPLPTTFSHRQFRVTTRLQLLRDRIDLGRDKDLDDIRQLAEYYPQLTHQQSARLSKLLQKTA